MSRQQRTDAERNWPRCPCCRTRRSTREQLQAHQREQGHEACTCGGYHHPHRPGSPYCVSRPDSGVRAALRDGWEPTDDELLDALIETTFTQPGRPMRAWPDDYRRD